MSFGKPWCAGHITGSMGSEEQSLSGECSSCHQESLMLASSPHEEQGVMRFVLDKLMAQPWALGPGRELGSSA